MALSFKKKLNRKIFTSIKIEWTYFSLFCLLGASKNLNMIYKTNTKSLKGRKEKVEC